MSLTRLAKAVALCAIFADGAGLITGVLMGGGYSESGDSTNDDPRSVLVEAVIVDYGADSAPAWAAALGDGRTARARLDAAAFAELVAAARAASASGGTVVRMPSALVQHGEEGRIAVTAAGGGFTVSLAPRVLKDDVLRLAVEAAWDGASSSGDPRKVELSTAFTSDGAGGVVLNLAGAGAEGGGVLLAIRPTLVEPAP
jgi:hypothetical protein